MAYQRFIDKDTCAHAVRALIISRLDYTNSLLHGISKYDINRLQRLQNKAAKLVFALGRREHVTPLLKDLHWLRMEERIKFKVLLHIFKRLHGQNPSYLKEAMVLYTPGHAGLRSNLDTTRLVTPTHAPLVIGDRSFFKAGPRLWNLILAAIRSTQSIEVFKKQQWRSHWGGKGAECHPWQRKFAKNREKEGQNQEKSGKKRTNREEKAKIGKFLSLCPSWQIRLATLLRSS